LKEANEWSKSIAHLPGRMCRIAIAVCMTALVVGAFAAGAVADDEGSSGLDKSLEGMSFGVKAYVDYSNGQTPMADGQYENYNRFKLTRGYFTVKKKMLPWLGMRLTIDVTQDGMGDYKVRQKYFYAELRPKDIGPLTGMRSEIGLGHMPWLDFEEHINPYRAQGTMAIERGHVFNSADVGISLRGELGGSLDDAKTKLGNNHYDGRYGSWHVGIYNGGGYHAKEVNENKVLEGRLTVRPLPGILPGLQASSLAIYGKGNTLSAKLGDYPDYNVMLGMLSFQHPVVVLTAQYYQTEGNAKGTWVDHLQGEALVTEGFSIFGNVTIPDTEDRLAVFGRLDQFDIDADDVIAGQTAYTMIMGGAAYNLYKGNMMLITYAFTEFDDNVPGKGKVPEVGFKPGDEKKIQVVYQITF